ncbi:MAG: Nif3-like dinuclear metal center hexameric protein [Anaerolineae bacterium]|nr:Nif3-like dinuclear metal center hexameric protein [Anaerolineae bacterium]
MERETLVRYLDSYLHIDEIVDYGPQGLQVESENTAIARVALSVDTAPAIVEQAAAWHADMLLVHHGILWRDVERIAGPLGARVRLLLQHGINLYAAHLPLDAHPEVGNNAELARLLGVSVDAWWYEANSTPLGVLGTAPPGTTLARLVSQIEDRLHTKAVMLAHGPERPAQIAIVSGAGAAAVAEAQEAGADTLITGETSHAHYWSARDHRMNVIFAGHYATETVGVKALGRHLAEKFALEVKFFDFPTGM